MAFKISLFDFTRYCTIFLSKKAYKIKCVTVVENSPIGHFWLFWAILITIVACGYSVGFRAYAYNREQQLE